MVSGAMSRESRSRLRSVPLRAVAPTLALASVLAASGSARGAEPGRWSIGLAPSYAYILLDGAEPNGWGGSLVALHDLTSAIALRLSAGWSGHSIDGVDKDPGGLYQVVHGEFGLRYDFDLVSLNPSLEGGIGVLHQRYRETTATDLGLQLGVGCDYWILPWISVGAFFHYYAFLSNPTDYPVYFDAGPRLQVSWR